MDERQAEGSSRIWRVTVHDGLVKTLEVTLAPDRDGFTLCFVGLDASVEDRGQILRLCTIPTVVLIKEILPGPELDHLRTLASQLSEEAKTLLNMRGYTTRH